MWFMLGRTPLMAAAHQGHLATGTPTLFVPRSLLLCSVTQAEPGPFVAKAGLTVNVLYAGTDAACGCGAPGATRYWYPNRLHYYAIHADARVY
jgi:hypothetical protein